MGVGRTTGEIIVKVIIPKRLFAYDYIDFLHVI